MLSKELIVEEFTKVYKIVNKAYKLRSQANKKILCASGEKDPLTVTIEGDLTRTLIFNLDE